MATSHHEAAVQRGKREDAHLERKDHDKYKHENKEAHRFADLERHMEAKEGLHDATANAKSRAEGAPKKGGGGGKYTFGSVKDDIDMGLEEVLQEEASMGQ